MYFKNYQSRYLKLSERELNYLLMRKKYLLLRIPLLVLGTSRSPKTLFLDIRKKITNNAIKVSHTYF